LPINHPDKIEAIKSLDTHKYRNISEMKVIPRTKFERKSIIKLLKSKTSAGYDGISSRIIKHCMNAVSRPINHICNASLNEGVFPDRLKYAIVKPIHKKGDKTDVSNYRPISLLTTLSKIFEQVMYRRLSQHLNVNKVITPKRFGFQKNCNTETAIYSLTNNTLNSLDERNQAVGIFCDLAKAFDCVNHDILLDKLLYYGIQGTTL
jgi:hypothetical protein